MLTRQIANWNWLFETHGFIMINSSWVSHDDVIKWGHFPRYCPFVWRIHRAPVNSPHKVQWRGVFLDRRLNKWSCKQPWGWWFETQSHPSWRHCNAEVYCGPLLITVIGHLYSGNIDMAWAQLIYTRWRIYMSKKWVHWFSYWLGGLIFCQLIRPEQNPIKYQ